MKNIFILLFIFPSITFSQNYVSTYSGNANPGNNNGWIGSATYSSPFGMCIDKYDNLYIADGDNNCIRKINTLTGIVSTFAGIGIAGWKDGNADSARFNSPSDLCIDDSGNVYVSDFSNQRVRKISASGQVTTIAGSGVAGFLDGNSSVAKFNYPRGICRDVNGNLYIGDSWNHRIRKIDTSGTVTTYAGGGTTIGVSSVGGLVDAGDTSARFYTPSGITIDQFGNIFVADAYNHRIRKIDTSRVVTTFVGTGATGPGNGGYMDGASTIARFNTPTELFIDTNNNELYISDTFNNRIRSTNIIGDSIKTFAGNGSAAFINNLDTLAAFNYPRGLVVSNTSGMKAYVVDYNNHSIRLITSQSTGLNDKNLFGNEISIFPNPTESKVVILGLKDASNKLELFNSNGEKLIGINLSNEKAYQVDLSDFPTGIYLMRISNEIGKSKIQKIIKQ